MFIENQAVSAPAWWDEAVEHLARCDPVLRELTERVPGERLVPRDDPFIALARAIVGQRLAPSGVAWRTPRAS
jgi:DNA-3-methyladenine glycosylase II